MQFYVCQQDLVFSISYQNQKRIPKLCMTEKIRIIQFKKVVIFHLGSINRWPASEKNGLVGWNI